MSSSQLPSQIHCLPLSIIRQIAYSKIETTIEGIIQELIENSIDAGATSIDIFIDNTGYSSIKVVDNGYGIHPSSFFSLCRYYHTSKVNDESDISKLQTFGFNGSSLSFYSTFSIVTIISQTRDNKINGAIFQNCVCSKKLTSISLNKPGTSVELSNLFYNLPHIREKKLQTPQNFEKIKKLLYNMSIIAPEVAFNFVKKGNAGFTISSSPTPSKAFKTVLLRENKDEIHMYSGKTDITYQTAFSPDPIHMNIHFICNLSNPTCEHKPHRVIFLNGAIIKIKELKELIDETIQKKNYLSYAIFIHVKDLPIALCCKRQDCFPNAVSFLPMIEAMSEELKRGVGVDGIPAGFDQEIIETLKHPKEIEVARTPIIITNLSAMSFTNQAPKIISNVNKSAITSTPKTRRFVMPSNTNTHV